MKHKTAREVRQEVIQIIEHRVQGKLDGTRLMIKDTIYDASQHEELNSFTDRLQKVQTELLHIGLDLEVYIRGQKDKNGRSLLAHLIGDKVNE